MRMDDYKRAADRLMPSETCRNEVLNMKQTKITQKKNRKFVPLLIAAAVMAMGGGTIIAADSLGAFDQLVSVQGNTYKDERHLPKWDENNYAEIAKYAETAEQPEEITESTEETAPFEPNVIVDTESVYCDGRTLMIGITGSYVHGNRNRLGGLGFTSRFTINGKTYTETDAWEENCGFYRMESSTVCDADSYDNFSGVVTIMLADENIITEPTTVELALFNIRRGRGGTTSAAYFPDVVTLSIPVTPKPELRNTCALRMEEDGFAAEIYEISPAGIIVSSQFPDSYYRRFIDEHGCEVTQCDVGDVWYDENGTPLEGLYYTSTPDCGRSDSHTIIYSYTDTSAVTIKWYDITTQEVLHEFTFDIPE